VESQIGDNCWKSASKARCCDGGNEETPIDGQNHLAHLCQVLDLSRRLLLLGFGY